MRVLLLLSVVLLISACGRLIPAQHQSVVLADLRPGAYALDPDHTAVLFKVDHLGFSLFVGRFNSVEASLDFSADDPTASRLEVLLDVSSIDTGLPDFDQTLRGPGWFDAARFPQARFVAREISVDGDRQGRVMGDLTLKGVTRPVSLDVQFNGGAVNAVTGRYTLGFAANGAFDRTQFGLDALAPAIGAQVQLEIHAEFVRQ